MQWKDINFYEVFINKQDRHNNIPSEYAVAVFRTLGEVYQNSKPCYKGVYYSKKDQGYTHGYIAAKWVKDYCKLLGGKNRVAYIEEKYPELYDYLTPHCIPHGLTPWQRVLYIRAIWNGKSSFVKLLKEELHNEYINRDNEVQEFVFPTTATPYDGYDYSYGIPHDSIKDEPLQLGHTDLYDVDGNEL